AFLTSLLFAIHPFLVEAVAWVSASKCIIYAFFYLLAAHFYLFYITRQKFIFYFLTVFFFICSLGSKEQAVTFPVMLILLQYVLKGNWGAKKFWMEVLPFLLLSIVFGFFSIQSQRSYFDVFSAPAKDFPFYQRIAMAAYTFCEYTVKCIFPIKISYLYVF